MKKRLMKQHNIYNNMKLQNIFGIHLHLAHQPQNLEAEMEGLTVLRGFDEHTPVEDILQDNDHTDAINTVLGKQDTKKAHKELQVNKQYYKAF